MILRNRFNKYIIVRDLKDFQSNQGESPLQISLFIRWKRIEFRHRTSIQFLTESNNPVDLELIKEQRKINFAHG